MGAVSLEHVVLFRVVHARIPRRVRMVGILLSTFKSPRGRPSRIDCSFLAIPSFLGQ